MGFRKIIPDYKLAAKSPLPLCFVEIFFGIPDTLEKFSKFALANRAKVL
jgi:hypothetical protein